MMHVSKPREPPCCLFCDSVTLGPMKKRLRQLQALLLLERSLELVAAHHLLRNNN